VKVGIRFPDFFAPVFYGVWEPDRPDNTVPLSKANLQLFLTEHGQQSADVRKAMASDFAQATTISDQNPLEPLSEENHAFLHSQPRKFIEFPELLPWVLRALDLCAHNDVCRLSDHLQRWVHPRGCDLLALLSGEYVDPHIRQFVVRVLETWTDDDINLYLFQLLQALQYSPYDDCPLALFLLRRAWLEPDYLGMRFFWGLRSLSSLPWMGLRVLRLTTAFLAYGSSVMRDRCAESYLFARRQMGVARQFAVAAKAEKRPLSDVLAREARFHEGTRLPIDPSVIADEYVLADCRIMGSKKRPLFTTYLHRATQREFSALLKLEDDLLQDALVLQLLSLMDRLWKGAGMTPEMTLYRVLPTGEKEGYIEVVRNASTITALQAESGRLRGAIKDGAIGQWLRKVNGGVDKIPEKVAVTFRKSLASYCVATYVLGIGDRHCSNMMIRADGHFFHIDFGHFLGHFKKVIKNTVDREEEVYFSSAMAHAIGKSASEEYRHFIALCGRAYDILIANRNMLVHLLLTMLGTGIPELQSVEDVKYLSDKLVLDPGMRTGEEHFQKLLDRIRKSSRSKANDLVHLFKHG
jgi:phosphatidylinositol-4,5-bisphosphate 3-kinase